MVDLRTQLGWGIVYRPSTDGTGGSESLGGRTVVEELPRTCKLSDNWLGRFDQCNSTSPTVETSHMVPILCKMYASLDPGRERMRIATEEQIQPSFIPLRLATLRQAFLSERIRMRNLSHGDFDSVGGLIHCVMLQSILIRPCQVVQNFARAWEARSRCFRHRKPSRSR